MLNMGLLLLLDFICENLEFDGEFGLNVDDSENDECHSTFRPTLKVKDLVYYWDKFTIREFICLMWNKLQDVKKKFVEVLRFD